jgi:hypothetical protein
LVPSAQTNAKVSPRIIVKATVFQGALVLGIGWRTRDAGDPLPSPRGRQVDPD